MESMNQNLWIIGIMWSPKKMQKRFESLLVGGIPTPLKNMKVSWDDYSQYMEKQKNVPNHQPDYIISVFCWDFNIFYLLFLFLGGSNTFQLWVLIIDSPVMAKPVENPWRVRHPANLFELPMGSKVFCLSSMTIWRDYIPIKTCHL